MIGTPDLVREQVATGFDMPVFVTSPPGDARLFVVEKPGVIRIIANGQVLDTAFLDISDRIPSLFGEDDERGLLGLAFHPDYAANGRFYVFYSVAVGGAKDLEVVDEFLVSADPNVADPASDTRVLEMPDFAGNHNGGMIAFGPDDGFLYIAHGDGGGGGDPEEYGQTTNELYGNILRIDVTTLPYTIPASNPFAAGGGEPEIWSYGLRNPWRFSFDRETSDMYIGDVGQNAVEEIDVEPASSPGGVNYGWNDMEGSECFDPANGCQTAGRTLPVYEYSHASGGCTVIGGYVYRGCAMPGYQGTYFFGDYCSSWVRSFRWDGAGGFTDELNWDNLATNNIVSFGEDRAGELYIVQQSPGTIYKIVPAP